MRQAGQVELASYIYDNPDVQAILLQRLRGRSDFSLNVYVDTEQFTSGSCRLQRGRLRELFSAGAQVYMCRGIGHQGAYHGKAVVIDRRFLYAGSANLTGKSTRNEEFCFKMAGPVVLQLLERLVVHRQKHSLWDGA